jgi:hypothetical protein
VERNKNEGALGNAGVRHFETGFTENEVTVEKKVEIERAWSVGNRCRAITAELALDGE